MFVILAFVLFVSLTLMIFAFGSATLAPGSSLEERLRVLLGRGVAPPPRPALQDRMEQALEPLSKILPPSIEDKSRTHAWLIQAGLREPRYLTMYYGLRVFLLLTFTLAVAAIMGFGAFEPRKLGLAAISGILGYFLPRFLLKRLITTRHYAIQLALPDALDLAIICVEAGLSLDQALQRVGQELEHVHPELSDEMRMVTLEIRAGKTRAEALRNLGLRACFDDMRALVAVLLQTDRFGTSVAQALRVHSDALRTERRQRAEEAAAKTTIKMVPVLVFFVFPPMFFVTMGPAVIELIRTLLPELEK
jgi:tight adherence protein C